MGPRLPRITETLGIVLPKKEWPLPNASAGQRINMACPLLAIILPLSRLWQDLFLPCTCLCPSGQGQDLSLPWTCLCAAGLPSLAITPSHIWNFPSPVELSSQAKGDRWEIIKGSTGMKTEQQRQISESRFAQTYSFHHTDTFFLNSQFS